jgi:hypothetical protein
VCADQGDWDGARAAMARAIDAASDNASYHALMAWYTYQCSLQPDFERQRLAEHHLKVALEMEPENAQAHYYQGMMWAGDGNTTRARIALSTALNLDPNLPAAAQALDKLGKQPAAKEPTGTFARPRARSKPKLVLPLALATVLTAIGAGTGLYYSGQPAGAADLAKQLGTKLPLLSTSRAGPGLQDLHIDVGPTWGKLSPSDQTNEMLTIARGAQGIGVQNVFVYSQSRPVAESHGDAICVGDCVLQPITKPAPGEAPRLSPAAAAQVEASRLKIKAP